MTARAHPIGSPKYVSFTTFRRSGAGVGTPVWFAPLDDGSFGFSTGPTSGKVKRLRNNATVEVQACDFRGRVAADATVYRGTAQVVPEGPRVGEVDRAVKAKYGLQARFISNPIVRAVQRVLARGEAATAVAVIVDLD